MRDGKKNPNFNKTWEYMYFLDKPQKIEIDLPSLDNYLNARYGGFWKISDEKLDKIRSDYNSINNFIKVEFDYSKNKADAKSSIPKESSKETHIRKNAAITGRKAELCFMDKAQDDWGWKVIDKTNEHGLGYDFECEDADGDKYFVEIKGCKGNIEGIRLTENEWNVAKDKTNQYLLMVVYDLDNEPKYKCKADPYNNFEAESKPTISITMHIKKNDLINQLEEF